MAWYLLYVIKELMGLSPKGDLGKKPTTANQTMAIYR